MTMPAVAPMPREVANCFEGKPGGYGRYVIASGPYMIEGSEDLNISSCGALKPISGYDGKTSLTLVRNPNYRASTDSRKARESNPDRFEFTIDTNIDDIYNKIGAGELEDSFATASPKIFREYQTSASKRKFLHSDSADGTYYITMNLTQPPFDDVHVRKAMNWVMDKEALRKAWGGQVSGDIAQHILPNPMLLGKLNGFQPYKTKGDRGSVAKARAEMRQSKYANSGGVCTAKECKGVLMIADVRAVDKAMVPPVQSSGEEDRDHVHRSHGQRCVPGHPDDVEERSDLAAAALVQGLRGPVDVHRPAVLRRQHHREREHELLARRPEARPGGVARHQGQREQRAEHRQRSPTGARAMIGQRAGHVLREHRPRADARHRAVGPVHVGQDGHDPRSQRHEVELRPVGRLHGVRARRSEVVTRRND